MEPSLPAKSCGVCMMSTSWREKQHPAFISYVSSFLVANSYRLNFLPIAPDFIFNNGGVSVAFIFETCWNCENGTFVLSRVEKLKKQFKHLYVVVAVPTREQNDSFNQSYLGYNFELGRPTFIPVRDPEMGFEKIVNISHVRGACKQRDAISMMKSERERAIQCFDALLHVVTAIPEIDYHDANALAQAFGSIEAIAKATSGSILESTDLSLDKAERIFRFFRDPQYHLTPRMN
ncbi:DNA ligase-like protein isoform X2 [Carex rostrata]